MLLSTFRIQKLTVASGPTVTGSLLGRESDYFWDSVKRGYTCDGVPSLMKLLLYVVIMIEGMIMVIYLHNMYTVFTLHIAI